MSDNNVIDESFIVIDGIRYEQYRDDIGRLRRVKDNAHLFICDFSGREHTEYLNPWPDIDFKEKTIDRKFIDDQTKSEVWASVRRFLRKKGLPKFFTDLLMNLAQRKIEKKWK